MRSTPSFVLTLRCWRFLLLCPCIICFSVTSGSKTGTGTLITCSSSRPFGSNRRGIPVSEIQFNSNRIDMWACILDPSVGEIVTGVPPVSLRFTFQLLISTTKIVFSTTPVIPLSSALLPSCCCTKPIKVSLNPNLLRPSTQKVTWTRSSQLQVICSFEVCLTVSAKFRCYSKRFVGGDTLMASRPELFTDYIA